MPVEGLGYPSVQGLANTGTRIEGPMKKRLRGETATETLHACRNRLRPFRIDAVHAAELGALIVAIQLAAGLSAEAMACRLLRALDDDDPFPL